MQTVTVNVSKTYDIIIGKDLLDSAGKITMDKVGGRVSAIITDDIVDSLYAERLTSSLLEAGYTVTKHVLPNGESSKNASNFIKLLNFLAASNLTRSDVVFALGGGVVGDIAGFAAASYLRGVRFVQVPTTLLAVVDSSVGGKTGIDLAAGKNLAGAFYQPDLVLCDYATLDTLPSELFNDGCSEVIKYGVICDGELFEMLKSPLKPQLESIINRCVKIKCDVVCADEYDTGRRQLLNFGHTFAHAIEKCSNFTVSHGRAVAAGMAMITRACVHKGICDPHCLTRLSELLCLYGLPGITEYSEAALFNAILADKKRSGTKITLVLPIRIGECILREVQLADVREYLQLSLKNGGG